MIGICRRILFVSMREDNEDKDVEGGGEMRSLGHLQGGGSYVVKWGRGCKYL